jgi:magnesium transporter
MKGRFDNSVLINITYLIPSLLSRAHSNYLTQINLRMNERAERTNDVLGKLTVLGTIVLPMNIVTGLFGMNTRVPGEQGLDGDLRWFWAITGGLLVCGFICFFIARWSFRVV